MEIGWKIFSCITQLKSFSIDLIKAERQTICTVSFGGLSISVKWHIISTDCELVLADNAATALRVIEYRQKQST